MSQRPRLTRRRLLQLGLALPLPLAAAACDRGSGGSSSGAIAPGSERGSGGSASSAGQALPPTPACDDGDHPTPAETEGPYFTPGSPERASLLEPGMPGTRLVVAGTVLATDCRPVGRALLDFWQADDAGQYDNEGFRLRGHQFSDAKGRWRLATVVPGLYPGRTRHIHVKVQAPDGPVLTTQLYFPGEPRNAADGLYQAALLLDLRAAAGARDGSFTFVLSR
jgi:protocatechuate 3,4-dioxygenase beta subunit